MIVDDQPPDITLPPNGPTSRQKIYVDGVVATIIAERVEYLDDRGRLVTESLRDFTKKALMRHFASLDDFLKRWTAADRKQAIIEELAVEGLSLEPLAEEIGKDLDPFDLICHMAFDRPPLTRRERAENVRKRNVFTKYGPQARAVLGGPFAEISGRRGPWARRSPAFPNRRPSTQWARRSSSSRNSALGPISSRPFTTLQAELYQKAA